jgi:pimeloyl-ACP methyl ester carboxylesterase
MVQVVHLLLLFPYQIPRLPALIFKAHEGNYTELREPLGWFFYLTTDSEGMRYSVLCSEEAPFGTLDAAVAASTDVQPWIREVFLSSVKSDLAICDVWGTGEVDPVENEPVISEIPTLVLAGEYDPVTPPAWSRETAESLDNAYYFEFPGFSHVPSLDSNPCAQEIIGNFLDAPDAMPDPECFVKLRAPGFYN